MPTAIEMRTSLRREEGELTVADLKYCVCTEFYVNGREIRLMKIPIPRAANDAISPAEPRSEPALPPIRLGNGAGTNLARQEKGF